MKTLYTLALSTALLLGSLGTQAQKRPDGPAFPLGSSQTLVQQLESQVAVGTAQRAKPVVSLRVSAAKAMAGQVNYREDLAATGEFLQGEIQGVPGSSFSLRIDGKEVEGHIILQKTKQAYRYSADSAGNVQVQEVDINNVVCIDYNKPLGYQEPVSAGNSANRTTVVLLQSLPGARGCVLLDFDGYEMPAGKGWNQGRAYSAPASGIENDEARVREFWELVSEDFRPLNLNVTTDEAVFNTYATTMRIRCVVSPGSVGTIAPGTGGIAYMNSFLAFNDTPCWVFMSSPKDGGEAASHEVGHTLGLSHDGRTTPNEGYFAGHGSWSPIMGNGYYTPVAQWSRGEYANANNTQDDLAIMTGTNFNVGYRADDHSNSTTSATALARSGNSLSGRGVIERATDLDYFSFSTAGGTATFNVSGVSRHSNLDIAVRLFNGSGALLGTYDTAGANNLNATFSTNLSAGTYYLQVDGVGQGNPATDGYSDYGSLGAYTISGTAPAPNTTPVTGVATVYRDCNYGGAATSLAVGDYTLAALQSRGILNNDISSLTVNSGYEMVLYDDDNFGGAALTLTSSTSCLVNNGWNDRATSLRVRTAAPAFSRQLRAEFANVNYGMQAEACTEGGRNMGYIDPGDYLVWNSINFPSSGSYLIEYRVAATRASTLSSNLNGSIQLGSTAIPSTNGWQNWTTVSRTVYINAGTYNFTVFAQTGGWNINWVRISRVSARPTVDAEPATLAPAPAFDPTPALTLYPNPATDRLNVTSATDLQGAQVSILGFDGTVVSRGTFNGETVDVSTLKPGLYTLVLTTTDKRKVVSRFSKE
ncbi:hypothetical protein GCM10023185_16880 [Hymenobacter saemangeumensis]|uniref:Carbohydrate-binding protein n=1 Tax=Hymenobacter saemangeumensis TaxID=1084522 RepID=A0ABP8IAI9_9BACT